jgi:asparagine synthase (glutamine-hydrolysing)
VVAAALRRGTLEDRFDDQPAVSPGGSLVGVADVRIDNRDELAGALPVVDDSTVPDSAFVLAAYERWGRGFLDRVVGDFALAIVDRRRGGVLLARDHVGTRPLVIHERPGVVGFSSNALALTALDGVGHTLDVRRAAEVLALVYSSERTFVQGVRWVPPGTALWVDESGVRRLAWWRPDPHEHADLGSCAAHERELREALDRAVAARLRSAGGVGAGTSGGLDSTSVAATAALQLAPDPLPTYTAAPPPGWHGSERPGWDRDESPLVLRLAELHPNMAPSFVHVPPGTSPFELHEPLWELGSGPIRNPCNLLWVRAIHSRAGADGLTTLLTGERGNMHFSADGPDWLASLVRQGRVATALREAARWGRASGEGGVRTLAARLVYPLLPCSLQRLALAAAGRDAVRDWAAGVALRPEVTASLDLAVRMPMLRPGRPDRRAVAVYVAQAGASQADGSLAMAALTGVEARDPTSDRRLLEVAMRQPDWVRRHDGVTRAAVRGAMTGRLPAEIVHRTRRGEQLPEWLDVMTASRAEVVAELEQLRHHRTSAELIDTSRLEALVRDWPARTASASPRVIRDYRLALLRALVVSRYLRWFENRAATMRQASDTRPVRGNA